MLNYRGDYLIMNTKTNNETTDKTLFLEKFDKKTYMKKYRSDPVNKGNAGRAHRGVNGVCPHKEMRGD